MPKTRRKHSIFKILKEASSEFIDDNAMKLSASLSYYTVFAIGPLLLVIISLIGIFVDRSTVTTTIYGQVQELLGTKGAEQIISIIEALQKQSDAHKFGIIGFVALFISASAVFLEIQDSINFIWSIKAKPKRGWVRFITNRLLSFSLIIGMGFLFAVSLLANTIADILTERIARLIGHGQALLLQGTGILLLFIIITTLFAIIYKVLPDAHIHWRDAIIGSSFTGVLFLLGKFVIGYYMSTSPGNTYGAAASIIIILLWVYYSGIILYFGAEFTKVWAIHRGHGIVPNATAVFILKRDVKEMPNEHEVKLAMDMKEVKSEDVPIAGQKADEAPEAE
ncbi:MAG: YihY/virulence factor BrkB family protein [Chitinophagaceae bacterium]